MKKFILAAALAGCIVMPAATQAQPMEYVRVCDAFGTGWFYVPGTETCVDAETGETREFGPDGTIYGKSELLKKADDALAGVALSLALPEASVDPGKTFGAAVNIGVFGDHTAIGVGGAFVAADGLTINGAVGASVNGGPVGGKAGVNFSW